MIAATGKAAKGIEPADLAQRLQDAWRAFHRGDFQAAYEAGEALGPLGASVAVKAIGIHATYLVDDEAEQLKRFEQAAKMMKTVAKGGMPQIPGMPNMPGMGGGFIGVDVFFVISGYLIASIVMTEMSAERFSLARFYERRARRILPALLLVVAVCGRAQ